MCDVLICFCTLMFNYSLILLKQLCYYGNFDRWINLFLKFLLVVMTENLVCFSSVAFTSLYSGCRPNCASVHLSRG